jgi:DegV family protein with EDD domain
MNRNVIIASDSTSDLSPELISRYRIRILPLSVTLAGKQYTDGVDIDPEHIYRHYEESRELPKTAAPNLGAFQAFFEDCTKDGSEVVFFTISATMSSTNSNARLAAEDFEGVHVVDTRNLSTGGGLLVLRAADLAAEGKSAAEIAEICSSTAPFVDASFVIDDLEFLHKGGRCSAVAVFGANLLQLKPCIVVRDGAMSVGKKYRGKFAATLEKYVVDRLGDGSDVELDRVFVTHAGCDESIVENVVKQVSAVAPFGEVLVTRAGCTVSSHCGRNTLGVLFIRKGKNK